LSFTTVISTDGVLGYQFEKKSILCSMLIPSVSTGRFLQKTRQYSGLKIHARKISEIRKLGSIREKHLVESKWG
jgi:hypothetical protein